MAHLKKLGHLYFCGRAEFVMNTNHVFPQGMLTAVTLVGDRTGAGGSGARAGYLLALPLCSVANIALLKVGFGPKLPEYKR